MLNLFDAIDEQTAEHMLEQHDRYEFGRVAVQRIERRWWVYFGAVEGHVALDPQSEPAPFVCLAEALAYALSPANLEAWETREEGRMQKAKGKMQKAKWNEVPGATHHGGSRDIQAGA